MRNQVTAPVLSPKEPATTPEMSKRDHPPRGSNNRHSGGLGVAKSSAARPPPCLPRGEQKIVRGMARRKSTPHCGDSAVGGQTARTEQGGASRFFDSHPPPPPTTLAPPAKSLCPPVGAEGAEPGKQLRPKRGPARSHPPTTDRSQPTTTRSTSSHQHQTTTPPATTAQPGGTEQPPPPSRDAPAQRQTATKPPPEHTTSEHTPTTANRKRPTRPATRHPKRHAHRDTTIRHPQPPKQSAQRRYPKENAIVAATPTAQAKPVTP